MFHFKNKTTMSVIQRLKAPTPKFFRLLQVIGLSLAATGGALATAPIELPQPVKDAAGYLAVAGGAACAVSQTAVHGEADPGEAEPYEEYEP
jgi:hypothetical protein